MRHFIGWSLVDSRFHDAKLLRCVRVKELGEILVT
jgi:hypothetical protein